MIALNDLPHFAVERIDQENADAILFGRVSGPPPRTGRSWLYVHREKSIIGDLSLAGDGQAVFRSPPWAITEKVRIGASFPIVAEPWQAYQVEMILDDPDRWEHRLFVPSDAMEFSQPGQAPGWRATTKSGSPLPGGAKALRTIPAGWDHEHCDLCFQKIGHAGQDSGHVHRSNYWLCERCYLASPRNLMTLLSFSRILLDMPAYPAQQTWESLLFVLPFATSKITIWSMVTVTVKLPPTLNAQISAEARKKRVSKSALIRDLAGAPAMPTARPADALPSENSPAT